MEADYHHKSAWITERNQTFNTNNKMDFFPEFGFDEYCIKLNRVALHVIL